MNPPTLSPNPARATNEIEQHRLAVRRNPRDANAHALLGIALLRQRTTEQELADGVACLQRALVLNPKIKGLHAVLAAALFDLGQYEDAAAAYRQALRFLDAIDLHQGLADALRRLGRHEEAEASARRVAELAPNEAAGLLTLANVLHASGRRDELVAVLERVLALDPDNVNARYDLGHLLYGMHRLEASLDCLREVVARNPQHAKAQHFLGLCLRGLRRYAEAAAALERAAALAPDNADPLADLGATLQLAGDLPQAMAVLGRALALAPQHPVGLRALIHCHFAMGEWQKTLQLTRDLVAIDASADAHSMLLFILSHCCLDGDELTREHFAFGERLEPQLLALRQPHPNQPDPGRQLRIGIVSADLYNHAVTRFVAPVFEALKDSPLLALHVFYNNTVEDHLTHQMRSEAAGWHSIVQLDDDAAERLIREQEIDILIDLSGHSAMNRLPLFARKPAPVQATWIGYAGTTGLRAMDYMLSDRFMVPAGRFDGQFTEKIVSLPLGAPFLPDPAAPPVNELPALANGYITFGSFHRASKLSREVIAHWAKLLHAVPDAKMLLGGLETGIDDVLVDWFAAEGIPRERLLLRKRSNMHGYLKQHYEVDVCVSPFPYTGATTVGHALWMGVPTLATVGATNPSHAVAVFMAHLGLGSFITESDDTYVKLGLFLSQNLPTLATMRATMRERFLKSALGYPGVAAAGLELALRKMWQRWCAGEAPVPLRVDLAELAPAAS